MVRVTLANIRDLELPVNSTDMIGKMGNSKRILKQLQKKYSLKSHLVCRKVHGEYILISNPANFYVPSEEKQKWIENYKVYVRASLSYKFWILLYKIRSK